MSDQDQTVESSDAAESLHNTRNSGGDNMKPLHMDASDDSELDSSSNPDDSAPSKTSNQDDGRNTTSGSIAGKISSSEDSSPRRIIRTASAESSTGDVNHDSKAMKVTCPPPGSDATSRIQGHDELMRLESRRRSEVSMRMQMYQDRWHTAKEILDFAADSVERAERLVIGFTKASEVFAQHLRAIAEDKYIDGNGAVARPGRHRIGLQNSVTFRIL